MKLRDLSGVELLRTLTLPHLSSPGALSSHRHSLSYHRIGDTHLLHPYHHFTYFTYLQSTSSGAIPLVIGHPNDPAAISFSNNGMSLVPVPVKISGAKESFEKLIGGYLISCSPISLKMKKSRNVKETHCLKHKLWRVDLCLVSSFSLQDIMPLEEKNFPPPPPGDHLPSAVSVKPQQHVQEHPCKICARDSILSC